MLVARGEKHLDPRVLQVFILLQRGWTFLWSVLRNVLSGGLEVMWAPLSSLLNQLPLHNQITFLSLNSVYIYAHHLKNIHPIQDILETASYQPYCPYQCVLSTSQSPTHTSYPSTAFHDWWVPVQAPAASGWSITIIVNHTLFTVVALQFTSTQKPKSFLKETWL